MTEASICRAAKNARLVHVCAVAGLAPRTPAEPIESYSNDIWILDPAGWPAPDALPPDLLGSRP
jgi:hypothetical protein